MTLLAVWENETSLDPDKLRALPAMKAPRDASGVRKYLGVGNHDTFSTSLDGTHSFDWRTREEQGLDEGLRSARRPG